MLTTANSVLIILNTAIGCLNMQSDSTPNNLISPKPYSSQLKSIQQEPHYTNYSIQLEVIELHPVFMAIAYLTYDSTSTISKPWRAA